MGLESIVVDCLVPFFLLVHIELALDGFFSIPAEVTGFATVVDESILDELSSVRNAQLRDQQPQELNRLFGNRHREPREVRCAKQRFR